MNGLFATRKRKLIAAGIVVAVIIAVGSAVGTGGSGVDTEVDSPAPTPTVDAEEAEDRRKGFHCLDPWDGNYDQLEKLIRAELHDPGSMETHVTRITPVNEEYGQHVVSLDFSASNLLGGMARHEALGLADPDTCAATLLWIE